LKINIQKQREGNTSLKGGRKMEERIKADILTELELLFGNSKIVNNRLVNYIYRNLEEWLQLSSKEEIVKFIDNYVWR